VAVDSVLYHDYVFFCGVMDVAGWHGWDDEEAICFATWNCQSSLNLRWNGSAALHGRNCREMTNIDVFWVAATASWPRLCDGAATTTACESRGVDEIAQGKMVDSSAVVANQTRICHFRSRSAIWIEMMQIPCSWKRSTSAAFHHFPGGHSAHHAERRYRERCHEVEDLLDPGDNAAEI
jgi:hypothetical protein